MSVRKNSVKLGVAAVAVAGLVMTVAAPAGALDAGPSTAPKLGTDIIGVGSDTTQWVMDKLTTDYDAAVTTGPRLINYDACVGNTNQATATGLGDNPDGSGFPCGADATGTKAGVPRPATVIDPAAPASAVMANGSGSAWTLLRTPTDPLFNDVAFARSSSAASTADIAAGEIPLPFAVDKFVSVVSPTGPAPATLTGQQILRIFNGTYTNWNQVGGKNAPIHPYLPKTGSGTYNSSLVFLAALDGVTEAPGSDNDPTSHSAAFLTWQGPGVPITDANGIPVRRTSRSTIPRSSSPTPTRSSSSPTGGHRWQMERLRTFASRVAGPRTASSTTSSAARQSPAPRRRHSCTAVTAVCSKASFPPLAGSAPMRPPRQTSMP